MEPFNVMAIWYLGCIAVIAGLNLLEYFLQPMELSLDKWIQDFTAVVASVTLVVTGYVIFTPLKLVVWSIIPPAAIANGILFAMHVYMAVCAHKTMKIDRGSRTRQFSVVGLTVATTALAIPSLTAQILQISIRK